VNDEEATNQADAAAVAATGRPASGVPTYNELGCYNYSRSWSTVIARSERRSQRGPITASILMCK